MPRGAPTKERKMELDRIVREAVPPPDQPGIVFDEIVKKINAAGESLGRSTISGRLSELEKVGFLAREVIVSEKPPYHTAIYHRTEVPKIRLPGVEEVLQFIKKANPKHADRFLHAITLASLARLILFNTETIKRAFKSKKPHPEWLTDKLIDTYLRPEMQSIIAFLQIEDPRTKEPIHKNAEIWKTIEKMENIVFQCYQSGSIRDFTRITQVSHRRDRAREKMEEKP